MDDTNGLYPSPLSKRTKYSGKLNERRKFDEQPYPKDLYFMIAELASTSYEREYNSWVNRQGDLDNKGFLLLAKHYNLDIESSDFYMKLALYLARDHVPAFHMKDASGRQTEWDDLRLRLLVIRVRIEMKTQDINRKEAIELLSKSGSTYEFGGNREGLRNLVSKGEKLLNTKKLDRLPLDKLKELEKNQLTICKEFEKRLKDWKT